MTRENIEGMREVILPFVKKTLLKINYENLGKSDAEEFERHFNEILDLALKALEQEPRKGHWIDREVYDADRWKCSECGRTEQYKENYCPNCGAKMESEEI